MTPPRVLIGWEFGDGRDALAAIVPAARELAKRGLAPVLALRDVAALPADAPFPVVAAPVIASLVAPPPRPLAGLGEFLGLNHYADAERLAAVIGAWRALLELVDPALLVAAFAPGLVLANGGERPLVQLGIDGFALPPAALPFLPVWEPLIPTLYSEDDLHAGILGAQRRLGLSAPETPAGLFAGDEAALAVLREFDPLGDIREPPGAGPFFRLPPPAATAPSNLLVELSCRSPFFAVIAEAATLLEAPVHVVAPDAPPATLAALRERGLDVLAAPPPPLDEGLGDAVAILHEGGAALAQAALAAGVPQILAPTLGQARRFHATLLQRLGVGVELPSGEDGSMVAAMLRNTLNDDGLRQRAAAASALVHGQCDGRAAERFAEACTGLARRRG